MLQYNRSVNNFRDGNKLAINNNGPDAIHKSSYAMRVRERGWHMYVVLLLFYTLVENKSAGCPYILQHANTI